jgi:hypothetical protein
MSRSRLVASWVATGLIASPMVSAGVAQVLHVPAHVDGVVRLGSPLRFVTVGEQDVLAEGGYVSLALRARVSDPRRARLQRRSH